MDYRWLMKALRRMFEVFIHVKSNDDKTLGSVVQMTERQLKAKEQITKLANADCVAKAFIMSGSDPPIIEVKFINDYIGKGVFATKNIDKGDFLLEYQGELITYEQGLAREKEYDLCKAGSFIIYFKDVKGKRCVDATNSTGMGRYVNDGWRDDKNCILKIIQCEDKPHVCMFANCDIKQGDELRFDYSVQDLPWRNPTKNGTLPKTPSKSATSKATSKTATPKKKSMKKTTPTNKASRKQACGKCDHCKRTVDCLQCVMCLDKKAYGGKGLKKQKCLMKTCTSKIVQTPTKVPLPFVSKSTKRKGTGQANRCKYLQVDPDPTDTTEIFDTSVPPQTAIQSSSLSHQNEEEDFELSVMTSAGKGKKRSAPTETKETNSTKRSRKLFSSETSQIEHLTKPETHRTIIICKDPRQRIYDFNSESNDKTEGIVLKTPVARKQRKAGDIANAKPEGSGSPDDLDQLIQTAVVDDDSQRVDSDDLGTLWLEGDDGSNNEAEVDKKTKSGEEDTSQKVSSQNDMSYLTQRRYTQTVTATQTAIATQTKSIGPKSEGNVKDARCVDDAERSLLTKKVVRIADHDHRMDQSIVKTNRGTSSQQKKRKKKAKKISLIPHASEMDYGSPMTVQEMPTDSTPMDTCETFIGSTEADVEDVGTLRDVTGVTAWTQRYQRCLAEVEVVLEERLARWQTGKKNRWKLASKMTREKKKLEQLLMNICSASGYHSCPSETAYPHRQKLGGEKAACMLKNLYSTLISQTSVCNLEQLNETSYELQVTFGNDGREQDQSQEEVRDGDEVETEDSSCLDTTPDTWKDISVIVRYTARDDDSDAHEEMKKIEHHIENMVEFLQTKIQAVQDSDKDVTKVLHKTIKKIRKKLAKLS